MFTDPVPRGGALLVAALLALSLVGPAPVAAVPDARLAVSDVTVSPATPTVGAQVVVDATLRNSAGSPEAVEIDRVELRRDRSTLATADDLGSLSPGDTVGVPLTATFDTPGDRVLTLRVVGRDADNDRVTVTRPVPVAVEAASPQVTVETGDAAVDSPTRVAVTVGNPTAAPVRDVAVRLADPIGTPNRSVAFVPTLAAGAEETVNLSTVPDAAGDRPLRVAVDYTDASGVSRTVERERGVRVAPYAADLGVEARRAPAEDEEAPSVPAGLSGLVGGAAGATGSGDEEEARPTRYTVEVTNFGTVRASEVVVTPIAGNRTLPRQRVDGALAPGDTGTVTVDLAGVRQHGPVTLQVDYRAGVRTASTTHEVDYRPEVAGLELTDVDVSRAENGSIQVSGNLVNVGRGPAQGVVVSVVEAGNVTPTYPARRYFVGELSGSDFAPFDLTARATGAVESVRVRIVAREAGVESARTVSLPVPSASDDGGAPVGLIVALGVGLPLAVAVGVGVGRRRRE